MKYDHVAIQDAQRRAFALLKERFLVSKVWDGSNWVPSAVENEYVTKATNITMPSHLVQETPWVTTGGQVFKFDFSISAPGPNVPGAVVPTTNNILLGQNNTASVYAIKILQGEGETPASRVYRSRGVTPADNALYNSVINMEFENSTLIKNAPGKDFLDQYASIDEFDSNSGLVLINPQRILTGKLGVFQLSINIIQSISTLILTPNTFISAQLYVALGQASATK